MTKIGKQGFMSTVTYSSSFTNANFMTEKQPKDQSQDLGRIARTLLNFKCHLNPDLSGT